MAFIFVYPGSQWSDQPFCGVAFLKNFVIIDWKSIWHPCFQHWNFSVLKLEKGNVDVYSILFAANLPPLTLFLPVKSRISPYMTVTWPSPVGIGLKSRNWNMNSTLIADFMLIQNFMVSQGRNLYILILRVCCVFFALVPVMFY